MVKLEKKTHIKQAKQNQHLFVDIREKEWIYKNHHKIKTKQD